VNAEPLDPSPYLRHPGPFTARELPETTWPRLELLDGTLIVTPAPASRDQYRHQRLGNELWALLGRYVPRGLTPTGPVNVYVDPKDETLFIPDVVVFRDYDEDRRMTFEDVVLAVEILSPSTASTDRILKTAVYRTLGAERYWLLDPDPAPDRPSFEPMFGEDVSWWRQARNEFESRFRRPA
jgi:Uma2 family endonuclease